MTTKCKYRILTQIETIKQHDFVSDTSRPMKSFETEGKEYHFVSRHTMENYIQNNKLVEFGEYKKCLYGTSVESIRKLMKMGKVCVLKVEPQVSGVGGVK